MMRKFQLLASLMMLSLVMGVGLASAKVEAASQLPALSNRGYGSPARTLDSMLGPEIELIGPSHISDKDWHLPAVAYNSLRRSFVVFAHAQYDTERLIYGLLLVSWRPPRLGYILHDGWVSACGGV